MSDPGRLATFHEIYQRHAQDVYRFALYLSGNIDQAKDTVSETFLRAWASPEPIRNETVKAYLLAIARNFVNQEHRSSWRKKDLDERAPAKGDLEEDAQARQRWRQAAAHLKLLPETQRNALLLRAVDGLSYNEIGAALGIPAATAKVHVHRARLKLAEAGLARHKMETNK